MSDRPPEVVLVRHGETEWSRAGRHTGRTDVPLTAQGRRDAKALGAVLRQRRFALVLTSPLQRSADTCRLAGLGDVAVVRDELREWDYGEYEGLKTVDIRRERPRWSVWADDIPGGESLTDVAERADRVVPELRSSEGDAAVFAHGHLLRVLAARWLGLEPAAGRLLALDVATISVLGYERETAVLRSWNWRPG